MKKMYCTLDTETVGGAATPKGFYHIGGFIHDRQGNVAAGFNLVVASMFEEIRYDDYAKKNWPLYEHMVTTGIATMVDTEDSAIKIINALCDFYNVHTMMAFNSGFDFGKTKASALIENRDFIDLYLAAAETLGQYKKYANFCRENHFCSSSKKNISMTAQSFYAFIISNPSYCEEHTALEDARIEMEIFKSIIKTHKKFTQNCVFYDAKNKWDLFVKMEG